MTRADGCRNFHAKLKKTLKSVPYRKRRFERDKLTTTREFSHSPHEFRMAYRHLTAPGSVPIRDKLTDRPYAHRPTLAMGDRGPLRRRAARFQCGAARLS